MSQTYDEWVEDVEHALTVHEGSSVGINDYPDTNWQDLFAQGISADEAALEAWGAA